MSSLSRLVLSAIVAATLTMPEEALGLRYAGPTGSSADDCQTPATACDLVTAIQGDGVSNNPSNGEEVIMLTGSYAMSSPLSEGAGNLKIHGEAGQPRPTVNLAGGGSILIQLGGTLSDVNFDTGTNSGVRLSGGTIERVFAQGPTTVNSPVCQCYIGTLRDSVFVATGTGPAVGVSSNGGDSTMTYRNVTAISTSAAGSAFRITQIADFGTLNFTGINVIARNLGGGTDVTADGRDSPGSGASTITLDHSSYTTIDEIDGGLVVDGGGNQTAPPLFTNAAGGDFSELAGSPTIDAGLTDPLNGTLDFAGNPRTVNGLTDIGAYEYVPPSPVTPVTPPTKPTFALGATKVKVKRSGKGRLPFSCTSPAAERCIVAGTLTAGGASAKGSVGQVTGTVPGGTSGSVLVKLSKRGRKRLATKGKLRVSLSGTVSNDSGQSAPLTASLLLKLKR